MQTRWSTNEDSEALKQTQNLSYCLSLGFMHQKVFETP